MEKIISTLKPFTYRGTASRTSGKLTVSGDIQVAADKNLIGFAGTVKDESGKPVLHFNSFYDQQARALQFNYSGGTDQDATIGAMTALRDTVAALKEEIAASEL